jgi:hypothetical protein
MSFRKQFDWRHYSTFRVREPERLERASGQSSLRFLAQLDCFASLAMTAERLRQSAGGGAARLSPCDSSGTPGNKARDPIDPSQFLEF